MIAATHWDKWVAIGTLALAGATFAAVLVGVYGAVLTRRLARAAQRTADADTRALENSIRPVMLPVPASLEGDPDIGISWFEYGVERTDNPLPASIVVDGPYDLRWVVSVPVRNAGVGPAVIAGPHPWIRLPNNDALTQGQAMDSIVPVGERTRLNFVVSGEQRPYDFYVGVAYTDIDGGQLRRTELAISTWQGPAPKIVGFGLYRGADEDLITASGSGWDMGLRQREWW